MSRLTGRWMVLIFCLALAVWPKPGYSQTVTANVTLGSSSSIPWAVAVNAVTNKVYVANAGSDNVTVIGGATNSVLGTVKAGTTPYAVAVNPITNKIYVANYNSGNITVIDGATDSAISTVPAGTNPFTLVVNPVTNKIYVANIGSGNVTVIDGATNSVRSTVTLGGGPVAMAVNSATNRIYIVNGNVAVIDGATDTPITTVPAGTNPTAVAINSITNKIYVASTGDYRNNGSVTVIDGGTNSVLDTVPARNAVAVAVNPITNKIYVVCESQVNTGNVTVIDGGSDSVVTVSAGGYLFAVAVNPITNDVYVLGLASDGSGTVTMIDGTTNSPVATIAAGEPNSAVTLAMAINPVTNKVYVTWAGAGSNPSIVTVIDGATNSTTALATAVNLDAVTVNPVTNKIYAADYAYGNVTVLDGATNSPLATLAVGGNYRFALGVNPVTNKIYVANWTTGNVNVINGATNSPLATVPAGTNPVAVGVNPVTNKIYVPNDGGSVTVIDGGSDSVLATVPAGTNPGAVAVNPVTNKVYVANLGSDNITVIDGATNSTSTVWAGSGPFAVAVNPITDKIYVPNNGGNVTVIYGATNSTTQVQAGSEPGAVAVNPVTNKIYVANWSSGNVTVIDGGSDSVLATVPAGTNPGAVAVNPVTNKIYVSNKNSSDVTVIDGATNSFSTVAADTFAFANALAVNPVTNKIYVAAGAGLTTVTEQQTEPIPLTTAISPLAGNVTSSPTPAFTFTVKSSFAPTNPTVKGVYYQFDTWQGPWSAATSTITPGTFRGTAQPLTPGIHILYAYATDGQDATSTSTSYFSGETNPVIGAISAYLFLFRPTGDLLISKIGPTSWPYGTNTAYALVVHNSGPDAANNVMVSDPLPAGMAFLRAVPTQGSCTAPPKGTSTVLCSLGNLASGATASVAIGVKIIANAGTTVTNTATVVSDTVDPKTGNNSSSVSTTVTKALAAVTLSDLTQTYDGTPKSATVTTNPAGLAVIVTYNGSPTPPVSAGSYSVVATVVDPNYHGSASGTLKINPALATLALSNLNQTYDGTPKSVMVTTTPAAAAGSVSVSYSPTPPVNAGSYTVAASLANPNYAAVSVSSTLVIAKASPLFSNLTASQAITFGTSFNLSGTIAVGSVSPPTTEFVSITINGTTMTTSIGNNGSFSKTVNAAIPASTTPYPITYSYPGDGNFANASNTSTTLTVNQCATASPGGFSCTGSLGTGRHWHTSTVLDDGTILIAGGASVYINATTALNTAELYNPATGTFTPTNGLMNFPHARHAATLLDDGRVLITGGDDGTGDPGVGNPSTNAELYDPATKTFTAISGMNFGRDQHTATLLRCSCPDDGKVLIAGGYNAAYGPLTSAELYDPISQTFTTPIDSTGTSLGLLTGRYGHTATALNNGGVLIVGGFNSVSGELSSAELYDPAAESFAYTSHVHSCTSLPCPPFITSLNMPRILHTATLLNDGRVLIAGGIENAGIAPVKTNSAELYNPATGLFTVTQDANGNLTTLNTARYFHAASLLNNGMVLFTGGQIDNNGTPTGDAELYDPAAGVFTPTQDPAHYIILNGIAVPLVTYLNVPRYDHTTTLLNNGSVLIVGGVTSSDILNTDQSKLFVIGSAELYQPLTQAGPSSITVTPNGARGSAAITPTNKGMVTGGSTVTINGSPGAQSDPHVSQNTASYTDAPSGQIRYYNFATSTDNGISNVLATGEVTFDALSDVNNTNVVFTRSFSGGSVIMLFDTVAGTLTTIDPTAAPNRQTPAIGNNTIAYIDFGFPGGAAGELVVHDIAANTSTRLTNDAVGDQSPHVSPNGKVVVWQSFNGTSYDIKQAVLNGTTWTVSNVTSTSDSENNPDTDGTYLVYDSNRATSTSGSDIYFRLVSGPEMQLAIPGVQTQPRIASGIIAFFSSPDGVQPNDLFVYRISSNELFQVTNTPTVSEVLNDISVLPNGDVRLVWSTGGSEADVLATTFTLPPPATPAIPVGTTEHFIATDPNTGQQLASVIWSSSNNTVVTISNDAGNSGTALAVGPGTATIQACVGTVCGSATLIVN